MATLKMKTTYTVYIISGGKKYNVTPALSSIDRDDAEGKIAQHVKLALTDVQVEGGVLLSSILKPINRVYVFANDGVKEDEVFRGFLWCKANKKSLTSKSLKVESYDHLIYLQESEDTFFFTSGNSTRGIVSRICSDWGIKLNYSYHSITHKQLALTGRLYDLLTADVLEETKKQTGDYYNIISAKDTMYVRKSGSNTEMYKFVEGENVVSTASGWTMDGVITKIIILGTADESGRTPVDYTESRNTEIYGTLQKIQRSSSNLSDSEVRKEARVALQEKAEPNWEYEIESTDIPWIRKGDAVMVKAGDIDNRRLIVTAISRSSDNKNSKMTLTMVDANKRTDLLKV